MRATFRDAWSTGIIASVLSRAWDENATAMIVSQRQLLLYWIGFANRSAGHPTCWFPQGTTWKGAKPANLIVRFLSIHGIAIESVSMWAGCSPVWGVHIWHFAQNMSGKVFCKSC